MAEGGVGISDVRRGQSPEYKALTKSYSKIVNCIVQSPEEISDQLTLLRVLPEDERRHFRSSRQDDRKARKIMDIVENKVESVPSFLHTFISSMDKVDWMKPCTDELKATLAAEQQSNSTSVSEHITLSDKILTIKHQKVILDKLLDAKAKWYYIGKGIGVEHADLMAIDNRYLPDTVRCLDEVLTLRLQRGELARSILCKTLRGKYVERDDVAKDIEQTSQDSTSTSEHTTEESPLELAEKQFDESDLENRTRHIQQKLTSLVTSIGMALKQKDVTTNVLAFHLQNLQSVCSDHIKANKVLYFDNKFIKKIKQKCKSDVREVFPVLRKYYSWINFGLIESIIDGFLGEDANIQRQWTNYQKHFKDYCNERVCKIPNPLNGPQTCSEPMQQESTGAFKIDPEWHEIRFDRLDNFKAKITRLLGLKPYTLYLKTVNQGCVELVFEVPQHVADVIFPPTEDQRQALKEHNITYSGFVSDLNGTESDTETCNETEENVFLKSSAVDCTESNVEICNETEEDFISIPKICSTPLQEGVDSHKNRKDIPVIDSQCKEKANGIWTIAAIGERNAHKHEIISRLLGQKSTNLPICHEDSLIEIEIKGVIVKLFDLNDLTEKTEEADTILFFLPENNYQQTVRNMVSECDLSFWKRCILLVNVTDKTESLKNIIATVKQNIVISGTKIPKVQQIQICPTGDTTLLHFPVYECWFSELCWTVIGVGLNSPKKDRYMMTILNEHINSSHSEFHSQSIGEVRKIEKLSDIVQTRPQASKDTIEARAAVHACTMHRENSEISNSLKDKDIPKTCSVPGSPCDFSQGHRKTLRNAKSESDRDDTQRK